MIAFIPKALICEINGRGYSKGAHDPRLYSILPIQSYIDY